MSFIRALDNLQPLFLLLAAPFLLFPGQVRCLALLVIPAVWLIAWLARGEPIPITPLNGVLLPLAVALLMSLFVTPSLMLSLPKICGLMLGLAVFFCVARLGRTPAGWWGALAFFCLSGIGVALLGLVGTDWVAGGKISFIARITSALPTLVHGLPGAATGIHPNEMAGALLWVAPVLMALPFALWRRLVTLPLGIAAGLSGLMITAVVLMTQSRAAWVALLAALSVMAAAVLILRKRALSLALWIVPLVLIIVLISVFGYVKILNQDFGSTFSLRNELWNRAALMQQDFFFTGQGMNIIRSSVKVIYPLVNIPDYAEIGHLHNEFLQAYADLGLPGLISLVALAMGVFGIAFIKMRFITDDACAAGFSSDASKTRDGFPIIYIGLFGGFLAHFFYGFVDCISLGARAGFLFWILMGLMMYDRKKHLV